MPLFDFECQNCKKISELLLSGTKDDSIICPSCGSNHLKKLLSAPSSLSGHVKIAYPSVNDTACCGSHPGEAAGCSGPGSCCGKAPG